MKRNMCRVFQAGGLAALLMVVATACAQHTPRITKEEAVKIMKQPGVVIIDVRLEGVWAESDSKIQGAVRENPDEVDSWMHKYGKDKTLIFYCS